MFIECSSFERGKTAEHELFIGLHARLIERVHALHIAGNAAGKLEETYELGKAGLRHVRDLNGEIGDAALDMRGLYRGAGNGGDLVEIVSGKIIESVYPPGREAKLTTVSIRWRGPS